MEMYTSKAAWIRVLCFFGLVGAAGWTLGHSLRKQVAPGEADFRFQAIFGSVAGLKVGSPVRLAGVDVGRVAGVGFVRRQGRDVIAVSVAVREAYAPLVRRGASIGIDSIGVLGDKALEIGLADPKSPPLSAGETVVATDPISIGGTLKKLDEAVDDLRVVAGFWRRVIEKTEGLKQMWDRFKKSWTEE